MTMRGLVTVGGFLGCLVLTASVYASPAPTDASDQDQAVAIQQGHVTLPELRDEAAMVLVGSALIGLAAAVRRSA